MKENCISYIAFFTLLSALTVTAQPIDTLYEDSICAYTWNSDYNNCPNVLECIYPMQWEDTVIDVPANITHISQEGLKLCLEDLEVFAPADIIYIVDLSYSMYTTSSNYPNPIQYPDPGWQDVGDPYRMRDTAVSAGFHYQYNNLPNSKAGYIGFGRDLIPNIGSPWSGYFSGDHLLPCVDVIAEFSQLLSIVNDLHNDLETDGRGTNYYAPLQRALQWVQDTSIMPHETKAIIFISDGNITVGHQPDAPQFQTLLNSLNANNVPIHGIYLGETIGSDLVAITDSTNGTLTLVPPNEASRLDSVVEQIVSTIQKPFNPDSLTVQNNTTGNSAKAISYQKIGDTAWAAILDQQLPLQPDINEIQLNSMFSTDDGKDTTLQFRFYINVGGIPEYTNECYYCWYRTSMEIFVNTTPVDTLTWQDSNYTIKLYYYGKDSLNTVNISVKSVTKGDDEVITITNPVFDGVKWVFTATVPFEVIAGINTDFNDTTQAAYEDLIQLSWQHPLDIIDTASASVRVGRPPNSIQIWDQPGDPATLPASSLYPPVPAVDTVTAGVIAQLYAKVFANQQWLQAYESQSDLYNQITWTCVNVATGAPDTTIGRLTANNVAHNSFVPIKAYKTVAITATLDIGWGPLITVTIHLYIQPGPAKMLVIEATNDFNTTNLNSPVHWSPIDMLSQQADITAYAILRDSLGNWVGPATQALWSVDDTTVVTVDPGPNDSGFIHKASLPAGQTILHAAQGTMTDTAVVITYMYTIDSIRIVIYDGSFKDIDTLAMRTDQDTTLYALGLRSDNGRWINLTVTWSSTGGITFHIPPTNGNQWQVSPDTTGTGIITATGAGGKTDSVVLIVTHGLPHSLVLYPSTADPATITPYSNPTTPVMVAAGDSLPLIANIFDHLNVWLSEYRVPPLADAITWTIVERNGTATGILTTASGAVTSFVPQKAYQSVYIIATYSGTSTIHDTVLVYVNPGAPHHLVIEASSNVTSLHADNPIDVINIMRTDTLAVAYAVIRDQFGNYVELSQETNWRSIDVNVVLAREGLKSIGEGLISRQAKSGSTYVIATSRVYQGLFDSVLVVLQSITYDALRITTANGDTIRILEVKTGYDTTLFVEGKRSDNGMWEPVNADWHITPGLSVTPGAPASVSEWMFHPNNTGSGKIWVSRSGSVGDTVNVRFTEGDPASVALYNKPGDPADSTVVELPPVTVTQTVYAGVPFAMCAKIFDVNGHWLSNYETDDSASLFTWSILDDPDSSGALASATGFTNTYTPVKAYRTIRVRVLFKGAYYDEITLTILPGPAHHLVIEGSQDWQTSPNVDNPVDTVFLTTLDTVSSIYAVLRDVYGNFVSHSQLTQWLSMDTSLVTTENGNTNIGEGFINRIGIADTTIVSAKDISPEFLQANLTDSTVVVVLGYYYTRLKIFVKSPTNPVDTAITSLLMNTNQDTTLYVLGQRSDDGTWENVAANWGITDTLVTTPAPPERKHDWRFSPEIPGTGIVWVSMNNAVTLPDTLNVIFLTGPPTDIEIIIVTPADSLIAGMPIEAKLIITNTNGKVPGIWPGDVVLGDLLNVPTIVNLDGDTCIPSVIINGDTIPLDLAAPLTFIDGEATVHLLLYYAPHSADPHQIHVTFTDTISHIPLRDTTSLILKPGPVKKVIIVQISGDPFPGDTVFVPYDGYQMFKTVGYDFYRNFLGDIKSDWVIDTIIPVSQYTIAGKTQLYFKPIKDQGQGYIHASASVDSTVTDSIYVMLIPPLSNLATATTRDFNGNGFLDAVELVFDRAFAIPAGYVPDLITVYNSNPSFYFKVDSITADSAGSSTRFYLHLNEEQSIIDNDPQTDWTPEVTITDLDSITAIDKVTCIDGAGPVVWRVVKAIYDVHDNSQDVVTVTLSEDFYHGDGSPFNTGLAPITVFHVWTPQAGDTINVDNILAGIPVFSDKTGNVATFTMSNGENLNANHFINCTHLNGTIADALGNIPNENNQKVRVIITGKIGPINIAPVPIIPNLSYYFQNRDRPLEHIDPNILYNLIISQGGAMITIDIEGITEGEASLMIFDAMGNLVYTNESAGNVIPIAMQQSLAIEGHQETLCFYWHGVTDRGMKAAPGVYRLILYLQSGKDKSKYVKTIAVGR